MTSDQQVHMHRIKGPDHVMFIETWSNRCGITYVTTAPDTTVSGLCQLYQVLLSHFPGF